MEPMKLEKLKIHHYRGVTPGTELTFGPSHNLVLGDNGTGRTTLLELISRLLCADFSELGREAFSLEYALRFPGVKIAARVRNEEPGSAREVVLEPLESALLPPRPPESGPRLEPSVEVTLQLDAPGPRLVVRADERSLSCEVEGAQVYSQNMHRWSVMDRTLWVLVFMAAQYLEPEVKEGLKELLRRTFLLSPSRFDESLGMFEKIGAIRYAMEMHGDEVFPIGLMALPTWLPGRLRARVEKGPPADILEFLPEDPERNFLAKFIALSGFATGKLRVELLEKRAYQNGGRLEFGRFGFHFTRKDGSELSEEHLGHGQKRLLSFLYYLDVNEDFVIADELANGLHPRLVEACLREVGERQSFLTSQSPLVFEQLRPGSAEELRASLHLCGIERVDGHEQLCWSNPTEEMSRKLFREYQEGSGSLGTLLRAHGLW
jgi:hypothetical protein